MKIATITPAPTFISRLLIVCLMAVVTLTITGCNKQENESDAENSRETAQDKSVASSPPEFAEILKYMDKRDFTATITVSGSSSEDGGAVADSTIYNQYDASGTIQSTVETPQGQMQVIITDDAFYMKPDDAQEWIKTSSPDFGGMTNVDFSPQQIEEISADTTLVYQATGPCPAGTCYIYAGQSEGVAYDLSVDQQTNLISQMVTLTPEGETVTVIYTFEEVAIDVPRNALDLGIPDEIQVPDGFLEELEALNP